MPKKQRHNAVAEAVLVPTNTWPLRRTLDDLHTATILHFHADNAAVRRVLFLASASVFHRDPIGSPRLFSSVVQVRFRSLVLCRVAG